jgi:hypothetical protein
LSAAPARHQPSTRRSPAPRAPRRVSGPARPNQRDQRLQANGAVALPRPLRAPAPTAPAAGSRLADALRALPDHPFLERLLRGRAWIALIALALGGIVAMQVSLLKLNSGIGRAVETSSTLERQNADLRATVSELSSEERIQREAAAMGLVMPAAGDVRYLTARGAEDAQKAARVMRKPNAPQVSVAAAAAATATGVVPTAGATPADPAATAAPAAAQTAQTAPAGPAATAPAAGPTAAATAPAQTPTPATAPASQQPAASGATPGSTGAAAASGAAAAPAAGGTP